MTNQESPYELVCVGFGPAAIAVAAAIEDAIEAGTLPPSLRQRIVFFEKQESTVWQGGLLLPGTNINHSPYRDLATPRDPRSFFTFARYLHEKGRIYEHGAWSGAPSRIEWSDYVGWAARRLSGYVRYRQKVEAIEPSAVDLKALVVRTARGTFAARQVMIACGMERYVPQGFENAPRGLVRHADDYLYYRDTLDKRIRGHDHGRFHVAIVGSGLSAAEIMHDLLSRHDPTQVQVTSLHRGLAYRHYDMSQFSNQIYMAPETQRFAGASHAVRKSIAEKTFATNFAGVDSECSAALWNFLYERRLTGITNAMVIDRHELIGAIYSETSVRLSLHDTMSGAAACPLQADMLILATGYRDTAPERLLTPLASEIEREPDGALAVHRDYRLKTTARVQSPIWLNGHCEHTHGIADTQSFSLIAHKAEQLLMSVFGHLVAATDDGGPAHALRMVRSANGTTGKLIERI
jgi:L-ornithine N5-oxygenase